MECIFLFLLVCSVIEAKTNEDIHEHHRNFREQKNSSSKIMGFRTETSTSKPFQLSEEEQKVLRVRLNECVEETRADPRAVVEMRNGIWAYDYSLEVQDWTLCVLQKSGLMSKEGVYKLDKALEKIPFKHQYRVNKLIDECLPLKPYPARVIAYKFMKCFYYKRCPYIELVTGLVPNRRRKT